MVREPTTKFLRRLQPKLHDGVYVFVSLPANSDLRSLDPIATFREAEGLTVVLEESRAVELGIPVLFRAAWITLQIQSDLAGVGLTAAVSAALAGEGIACNVIAAAFHDHLFVPAADGARALRILRDLAAAANS